MKCFRVFDVKNNWKIDCFYVDKGGAAAQIPMMRELKVSNGATFNLGYDASLINENLPLFVFRAMRKKFGDISDKKVGLLGMAFKGGVDDIRDSLAYRMKKILENEVKEVICSDCYVKDDFIVDVNTLIRESDIIILMCMHEQYKDLKIDKPVIDLFNFFGMGIGL